MPVSPTAAEGKSSTISATFLHMQHVYSCRYLHVPMQAEQPCVC